MNADKYVFRCPACSHTGARAPDHLEPIRCTRCKGVWISEKRLAERITAMSLRAPRSTTLPFGRQRGIEERDCPECAERMRCRSLHHVPVEYCRRHGVWLDAGEMQRILMRAQRAHEANEKRSEESDLSIILRWFEDFADLF